MQSNFDNNIPDVAAWLATSFYRVVNATVQFVAAFAAISVANTLAPSIFLFALKFSLPLAFVARVLFVVSNEPQGSNAHWIIFFGKLVFGCVLAGLAIGAASAAVDAGLVQLDSKRAEKAATSSNIRGKYRRLLISYGCWDYDYAAVTPVCQKLTRMMTHEIKKLEE